MSFDSHRKDIVDVNDPKPAARGKPLLYERNGHLERIIRVNGKIAAIFEEGGAWCVDDGEGNEVARGLRDEERAEKVAVKFLSKR